MSIAVLIFFMILFIGFYIFFRLIEKIAKDNTPQPPYWQLFLLFATYGGLLLVIFTAFFLRWNIISAWGCLYLITIAPVLSGIIAYRMKKLSNVSVYHAYVQKMNLLYVFIGPLAILEMVLLTY